MTTTPFGGGDDDTAFPTDRVLIVSIEMLEKDWYLMIDRPWDDVYYPANINYDGTVVNDVGVRIKGISSRREAIAQGKDRFSLKVKANKFVSGQRVRGQKKLNLNNNCFDPSFMAETLSCEILREFVPTPQTTYGDIYLNGLHLGLYTIVQQVDDLFFEEWGTTFLDGDLYRVSGSLFQYQVSCRKLGFELLLFFYKKLQKIEKKIEFFTL